MNINRITVHLRPRNQWEAIDMGVVVGRKWFFRLWFTWIISALPFMPLWALAAFLLPGDTPFLFILLFWIFKPLYEPPMLHWLSRILFDEKLTTKQAVREIRATTSFSKVAAVCRSRLNPLRSFNMPVLLLEGLTGKGRKQRAALLNRGYETALYLTLSCFCIEFVLTLSLSGALYWMIPERLRWVDFGEFIFMGDTWFSIALYMLSCSLVAPFYICSGFFLYLSRRVELEAWDLELGFKQINRQIEARRKKGALLASAALLFTTLSIHPFLIPPSTSASQVFSPDEAKETINKVMESREFGEKKKVYRWVPKKEEEQQEEPEWLKLFEPFFEMLFELAEKVGKFLGESSRYIVWIGAGALIALILLRYRKISSWLTRYLPAGDENYTPPTQLFGMDIHPDSLPDDIEQECRQLLEHGRKRDALSLLYRGVLSRLVNHHRLFVSASLTENECCSLVEAHRPEQEALFFDKLTALWLTTAYGHREPPTGPCLKLVDQWCSLYGESV